MESCLARPPNPAPCKARRFLLARKSRRDRNALRRFSCQFPPCIDPCRCVRALDIFFHLSQLQVLATLGAKVRRRNQSAERRFSFPARLSKCSRMRRFRLLQNAESRLRLLRAPSWASAQSGFLFAINIFA